MSDSDIWAGWSGEERAEYSRVLRTGGVTSADAYARSVTERLEEQARTADATAARAAELERIRSGGRPAAVNPRDVVAMSKYMGEIGRGEIAIREDAPLLSDPAARRSCSRRDMGQYIDEIARGEIIVTD
ncbi:hypothetical protein J421_0037 [Gemmatirosa kalamazoonensis]|uniref:Uncharacterized protein n=1 Tax=Gemmatirosa kalamazoonensis TaxID=861299 RepID=W0R8X1_9BACT|nr:hypothetical protein [Gemmatirosa kalamazoonensis]AHG87553.1 hypothetical protein J421_0015 [Gemmatirosa kalamazoonensis]AHG87574.1 hypothetical protein J421_0037 [Gemmatirosa kalamazoonensis]